MYLYDNQFTQFLEKVECLSSFVDTALSELETHSSTLENVFYNLAPSNFDGDAQSATHEKLLLLCYSSATAGSIAKLFSNLTKLSDVKSLITSFSTYLDSYNSTYASYKNNFSLYINTQKKRYYSRDSYGNQLYNSDGTKQTYLAYPAERNTYYSNYTNSYNKCLSIVSSLEKYKTDIENILNS